MSRKAATEVHAAGDRILDNLGGFIEGAEDLLKATKHFSGENLAAARARVEDELEGVRDALGEAQAYARDQARQAIRTTDRYVHRNPWQAIGVAMAVGVALGWLSNRR